MSKITLLTIRNKNTSKTSQHSFTAFFELYANELRDAKNDFEDEKEDEIIETAEKQYVNNYGKLDNSTMFDNQNFLDIVEKTTRKMFNSNLQHNFNKYCETYEILVIK